MKERCVLEGFQTSPVCPCGKSEEDEYGRLVWSIGGMMTSAKNRNSNRNLSLNVILLTTNPTWTGLGSNPGLHCERPVINSLD
jgi:hypothetical protein